MSIIIKSSSDLRNNYKTISEECRDSNNPIFITVNGQNDTVIMSQQTYNDLIDRSETALRISKVREGRRNGVNGLTLSDLGERLNRVIEFGVTDSER